MAMLPKSSRGRGARRNPPPFRGLSSAGDQIVKRITQTALILATGAGTTIPVTSFSSTDAQTGGVEFTSFATRYQQYRVRAIRVRGKAIQPVQTATVTHSTLHAGDYIGASGPASDAQVFSDENVKEFATYRDFTYVATWRKNPNAELWNPSNAAVPLANRFAIAVSTPATPPLTTATTYYSVSVEWEVEFRGSQ
jgi:hypothetical protein